MNLELKHLAPYLPYGLLMMKDNLTPLRLTPLNYTTLTENECRKPILRPLSDLCKEIDGVVPIDEFFLMYGGGVCDAAKKYWKTNFTENIMYSPIDSLSFGIASKLFEWHFDVYGLIDKGLAININDL